MAVTVDATASAAATTASATTLTNSSLTVSVGATALLAVLQFDEMLFIPASVTVNWDSGGTPQAMTLIASIHSVDTNIGCYLFGLVNPTPGNKNLTATWTNAIPGLLDAISFNGTINSTVANAFLHAATNSGASSVPTLSVTSAVGNIVVAAMGEINTVTSLTATGSTSGRVFGDTNGFGFAWSRAPGAATVAWTGAPTSIEWAAAGVDIVAGAANLTVTPGVGEFTSEFTSEFGVRSQIVITGRAPSANTALAPATRALVITGSVPTVTGGTVVVTPAAASLVITGRLPRGDSSVAPATRALVITGFVPSVSAIAPAAASLIITGFVPVVSGVATLAQPGAGLLTITGFAPAVPSLVVVPVVVPVAPAAAPDFLIRLKAVLPRGWFPDVTPVLDGVLSGCAAAWTICYDLLTYVRRQTRIATATGVFLDLMARDYFSDRLKRFVNENDTRFSRRIRASLLPQRGTRAGLIAAVTALVGEAPTVFEPANTGDTGAYGGGYATVWRGMAYNVAGGWGSLALPFQAFITSARARDSGVASVDGYGGFIGGWGVGAIEYISPDMIVGAVPDDVIYQTISEAAPAGSIMWTRLSGATSGTWDNSIWDSGVVWV